MPSASHAPDPAPALPPVEERISFLTHRIAAHMARICNPMFRDLKVDILMSRMLVILLEKGPQPAGTLVRVMALPQSTISHQLKRLERLGYVRRGTDPTDSRSFIFSLSTKGHEVGQACNDLSREVSFRIVAALGPEDTERTRAALKRVDTALAPI